MIGTREVALKRALAFLTATGLPFAVQMEDGTFVGQLKVAPPEPEGKGRARKSLPSLDLHHNFNARIQAMAAGEALLFEAKDVDEARRLASNVAAAAYRYLGKDNYITALRGMTAEVLRVS